MQHFSSSQVRKPRWVETPDGSGFSLERQGSLIVELAPVAPSSGSNVGARSYSWDRKQVLLVAVPGGDFLPRSPEAHSTLLVRPTSMPCYPFMQCLKQTHEHGLLSDICQFCSTTLCCAQTFALSPVELAGVIECCMTGKSMKELFHDPNKGRECALL